MRKLSSAFISIFLFISTCPKYVVLRSISSSNLSVLITLPYTPSYTFKYSAFNFSGLLPKFTSALTNSSFLQLFIQVYFLSIIHLIYVQVMKSFRSICCDIFNMITQYGPFFHVSGGLFLVIIFSFC